MEEEMLKKLSKMKRREFVQKSILSGLGLSGLALAGCTTTTTTTPATTAATTTATTAPTTTSLAGGTLQACVPGDPGRPSIHGLPTRTRR